MNKWIIITLIVIFCMATAIPGSSNPEHIKENYNIFDFELSQEDMNRIKNLNKNQRYENW